MKKRLWALFGEVEWVEGDHHKLDVSVAQLLSDDDIEHQRVFTWRHTPQPRCLLVSSVSPSSLILTFF